MFFLYVLPLLISPARWTKPFSFWCSIQLETIHMEPLYCTSRVVTANQLAAFYVSLAVIPRTFSSSPSTSSTNSSSPWSWVGGVDGHVYHFPRSSGRIHREKNFLAFIRANSQNSTSGFILSMCMSLSVHTMKSQ